MEIGGEVDLVKLDLNESTRLVSPVLITVAKSRLTRQTLFIRARPLDPLFCPLILL